ncbi:ankyrin repeat domain-containing protein 16-like [Diabrotica undecimpunctata]|uniref:ankyrin repeat domain-containing protein 16-like n=1 Tax=Diabrotica undecimpunctata TaxID=50387 RepID=UPI003B632755
MDVNSNLLALAIRRGDYTEVASLLDKGLDVNGADSEGYRPLHEAVKGGYLDIVELLLQRSANVNLSTSRFLITPLHLAAIFGHVEVVKLLITYGTSLETNCKIGLPPNRRSALSYTSYGRREVSHILQNESKYDGIQCNFTTPLILAADCGNNEVVELLIQCGADVKKTNDDGCTVLHIASGYGDTEIVSLLLQKELDLDAKINSCGSTPLHLASNNGSKVMDLLLHEGANPMARDRSDKRPLDIVCDILNVRISGLLLGCPYRTKWFEHNAELLIKFMLLFSKDIEMKNLEYWAYDFCYGFKRKYEKIIEQMEACLIENTTVSLYMFLQALYDEKKLLKFLSNHQLRQEVKHIDKYIVKYKLYSSIVSMVTKKVQEGIRRLDLLEKADTAMKMFAPNLVFDCRQIIINFLSNDDLSSLTESVKSL